MTSESLRSAPGVLVADREVNLNRWGPHAPEGPNHRYRGENGLFLETVVAVPSRAPNSSWKVVRCVSRETLQLWSNRPARRQSFFGLENGHLRHQIIKKIRCAALMKAAPYLARGNLYGLGGRRAKNVIFCRKIGQK